MTSSDAPTPAERSLTASARAHMSWGRTVDRARRTAPARAAFDRRFLKEADGDPQRAESLRSAYYRQLAARSIQARRQAKASGGNS